MPNLASRNPMICFFRHSVFSPFSTLSLES
jgi:hypothetical protein